MTAQLDWRAERTPGAPVSWRVIEPRDPLPPKEIAFGLTEAQAKLIAAAPAKEQLCEELADAVLLAWKEFNAIRARSGAPLTLDWGPNGPMQGTTCAEDWWNEMTEMLETLAKKAGRKP